MKKTIKLLTVIIALIAILVLSSCAPETIADETIAVDAETETTLKDETSSQPSQSAIEIPRITIDELLQLIESDANIIIVDLRGETSYRKSHIKGAINVLSSEISAGEFEPPDGYTIILYWSWHDEGVSAREAQELKQQGYNDVKALLGGYLAWANARYPLESDS